MKCVHNKGSDSTLQTSFLSVDFKTVGKQLVFISECTVCGSMTEPCFIPDEAMKRACAEWWAIEKEKAVE